MVGFIILAVIMLAGGIGVVAFRQPVHAALSLVATLLTLAVTYITLEAHFLAAIQTIVYAGAIMVLFLFVIMLLNVGGDAQRQRIPGLRPAAYLVGLLAAAGITVTAFLDPRQLPSADMIQAALGGGNADRVGQSLFGDFLLGFHLVGVLLLVGIIGAVSLVQRETRDTAGDAGTAEGEPERELTRA